MAARFYQMLSGHAMSATFLKDKWGWVDSEMCWRHSKAGRIGGTSSRSVSRGRRNSMLCGIG